jgi:UDPglucose 6-dehydrogenase/GDP-mannose 6-dehydrogenase
VRISVLGVGYVGLVTGACFADTGHVVTCVDVDPGRVAAINRGECPIFETGLPEVLGRTVGRTLSATLDAAGAIANSEITFIAVGTPFDGERIDLGQIHEAARIIGRALRDKPGYHVVVVKSTVVPGTTDGSVRPILEQESGKRAGADFGLGMNPEFLTEGEAINDFMYPDRIVLGGLDARTQDVLAAVYAPFAAPLIRTNNSTAELIKYSSNALLATLISFSNELANLATALGGIDAAEVMRGLHASRYLSTALDDGRVVVPPIVSFLLGGCGFGGSCLPKDVAALAAHGTAAGVPMRMMRAVLDINANQHQQMIALAHKHLPSLAGRRVTVLGVAFRPDTNDTRESPAIPIVTSLLAEGAQVVVYDPAAAAEAERHFGQTVTVAPTLEAAVADAEAILIVTSWREFLRLPDLLATLGRNPVVIDGRRMLPPSAVERYEGIGRA